VGLGYGSEMRLLYLICILTRGRARESKSYTRFIKVSRKMRPFEMYTICRSLLNRSLFIIIIFSVTRMCAHKGENSLLRTHGPSNSCEITQSGPTLSG